MVVARSSNLTSTSTSFRSKSFRRFSKSTGGGLVGSATGIRALVTMVMSGSFRGSGNTKGLGSSRFGVNDGVTVGVNPVSLGGVSICGPGLMMFCSGAKVTLRYFLVSGSPVVSIMIDSDLAGAREALGYIGAYYGYYYTSGVMAKKVVGSN